MSRREKFKQSVGEITGNVKELFKRKDKSTTGPSTPSNAHAHMATPTPATRPLGSTVSGSSANLVSANLVIPTEQAALESQIMEDPSHEATQKPSGKPAPRKYLMAAARGVVGSTSDVFRFGPLYDIFHQVGVLGDTFKMEGTVEKEYVILQDMIQEVLKRLDEEFNGGSSTPPGIERLRKSIQRELEIIRNTQGRSQGRRIMEAHKEADEIQACYRRIAGYWGQLTLDTNHEIRRMTEEKSKIRIDRLPSSPSAWYNSNAGAELKRRECTPGTRLSVLANLLGWAGSDSVGGVYWLNGMAGTGKTTIAYSVCKLLTSKRKLAASFFCSRLREECRNVNNIIPSIAYQVAQFSLSFQSALSAILERDQDAHHRVLDEQFEALIRKPLLAVLGDTSLAPVELVVVIDALDECENKQATRTILNILLNKSADLPVKFIVSSRPETQIRDQMVDEQVKARLVLHELDMGEVQTDIRTYLREELKKMKLSTEELELYISQLVEKAGILFIYAATAVRYIGYDNFQRNPTSRLRTILNGPQGSRTAESKEIDRLYITILEEAFRDEELEEADRSDMQQVLYTVICAREPLTVKGLSELLQINDDECIRAALRPLWSVFHVVGTDELVTTLHASFAEFMFEPARSKAYHCDSDSHHRKLGKHCLDLIARTQPDFNICGLESSYVPDREVPDINNRVANVISSELLYACRYWAKHVEAANCASSLADLLRYFLSSRLLLWMEVLNLKDQMKAGIECVKLIVEWCKGFDKQMELVDLAYDAKRFVDAFTINPVSQSTPHIYVSMLAFWPKAAPVANHYAKYTRGPVDPEGTALERRQLAHLSTWAFEKAIEAMVMSPDGLHIALAIGNNMLVVDSSSGKVVLGPLQPHPKKVISVAFSPDGTRVFAGCADYHENVESEDESEDSTFISEDPQDVILWGWNTHTGDEVLGPLLLVGHTSGIYCMTFSLDCSRIATGSLDNTLRLWDAETGKMLHRLEARDAVLVAVFSPDGTQVLAGAEKTLHCWDSRTGEPSSIPLTHIDDFDMIAFSPDQSCIISGSRDGSTIYVWNALSGDMIRSIAMEGHTNNITRIAYSPDGKYIVSGSLDQTVRVWDAQSGNMVLGPLEGHTDYINSLTFSPDGSRIITACQGGLVCTWEVQHQHFSPSSNHSPAVPITCVKFSSDGALFISGSKEGAICVWNALTGEMTLGPFKVHTSQINAVHLENNRVVSGSEEGKLCVCDIRSEEVVLGPFEVDSSAIRALVYSPGGSLIATGSSAGVDVWNAQDGSRVLGPLTDLYGAVYSVQFSPDGTRIVASSEGFSSNVVVWDVSDGTSVFGTLDGHTNWVRAVSYSPSGALIASGSGDWTIILWDAYTGKQAIGRLVGHSNRVVSVSFSPDSTRLVSSSFDGTIRIWDVQTGEIMFELGHGHEHSIMSVEFSPDGTLIMSRTYDMSVRIHDARSPEERAQSRPESEVGDWTIRKDGWVVDDRSRLLVWVPGDLRKALMLSETRLSIAPQGYVRLKFDKSRMGESWAGGYTSDM